MSSLVTAEGGRRAPRVVPKVFADVPSASELAAVRRNRNQLAVWVVLLFGMLAATVALLVVMNVVPAFRDSGADLRNQWASRGSTLDQTRAELDKALDMLNEANAAVGLSAVEVDPRPGSLGTDNTAVPSFAGSFQGLIDKISEVADDAETAESRLQAVENRYESRYGDLLNLESQITATRNVTNGLLADPARRGARQDVDMTAEGKPVYNYDHFEMPASWREAAQDQFKAALQQQHDACVKIENWTGRNQTTSTNAANSRCPTPEYPN